MATPPVDDVVSADGDASIVAAGILVSCAGFDGQPVAGVAFDPVTKRIPSEGGRITNAHGQSVAGQYVTGWIKRGPSGRRRKLVDLDQMIALARKTSVPSRPFDQPTKENS